MEALDATTVSTLDVGGEAVCGGADGGVRPREAGERAGHLHASALYLAVLRAALERAAKAETRKERALERENLRLKAALAAKVLEADFFKGVLRRIEAQRQPVRGLARLRLRGDPSDAAANTPQRRVHVPAGPSQPGRVLSPLAAAEPRSEEIELRAEVQRIALTHRRNYGYRRVTEELRGEGWAVNRKPGSPRTGLRPPAELASASPATLSLQHQLPLAKEIPANGIQGLCKLSHFRGSPQTLWGELKICCTQEGSR